MTEYWCPGSTSRLVHTPLLAAISVDRLSQLPQVNVAGLNGSRTHDCRRLKRWLHRPPVMACGHGRQRKCKFFHRSAPPWRKTITKKKILALSQPPSQHTCQPSICSPTSTGRGKRRNLVSSSIGSHLCLWFG